MASGEVPDLQKPCTIPDAGPYPPYFSTESSGLMLGVFLSDMPFRSAYLRARGIYLLARLDTGRHEIAQPDEVVVDHSSSYVKALIKICEDENAQNIPKGSFYESRQALLNGYFEKTVWISEVPVTDVKSENDIEM